MRLRNSRRKKCFVVWKRREALATENSRYDLLGRSVWWLSSYQRTEYGGAKRLCVSFRRMYPILHIGLRRANRCVYVKEPLEGYLFHGQMMIAFCTRLDLRISVRSNWKYGEARRYSVEVKNNAIVLGRCQVTWCMSDLKKSQLTA